MKGKYVGETLNNSMESKIEYISHMGRRYKELAHHRKRSKMGCQKLGLS